MGAVFANAPITPTVAAVQVRAIYFHSQCAIRGCCASATTNSSPVDSIGRPLRHGRVHAARGAARRASEGQEVRSSGVAAGLGAGPPRR